MSKTNSNVAKQFALRTPWSALVLALVAALTMFGSACKGGKSGGGTGSAASTSSTLAAPANLQATPLSASQVQLRWVDQAIGETGFQIESATQAGAQFAPLATVAPNTTLHVIDQLSASTTYLFRIRAYDNSVWSQYSNQTSATTLAFGAPVVGGPAQSLPARSWSAAPSITYNHLRSVHGLAANYVMAVGLQGTFLHFNGTQWSTGNTTSFMSDLHDVWGSAATSLYAVGANGMAFHA